MTLDAFIEQELATDHLWIFVHVNKTAGSSFGSELADARPPYRNIHVIHSDQHLPLKEQMDEAVQRFLRELDSNDFKSCSGHFTALHAEEIAQRHPKSKLITILRDPVQRVISDFRYSRTPAHPPHKDFIARYPTIESYVEDPLSQNKMFRMTIGRADADVPQSIEFLNTRYAFVGLFEMYAMSFNIAFRLFGTNRMPVAFVRRTEINDYNKVIITPSLRRLIKRHNQKDIAIYNHVLRILSSKSMEWIKLLGRDSDDTATAPSGGSIPRVRRTGSGKKSISKSSKHSPLDPERDFKSVDALTRIVNLLEQTVHEQRVTNHHLSVANHFLSKLTEEG